jgi:alginate O-acetyltransferase complex protein AlgI
MIFHSPNFLIFFILLLLIFYSFKRGRIAILATANAVFYGATGWYVFVLFVTVTLLTFAAVHLMRRMGWKWPFWVGLLINLLNLTFFKYTLFIASTLDQFIPGSRESFVWEWLPAEIILPIGISFYTFQLISYLVDVYRGDIVPTKSFIKFWVYISLFPQLVAGPIMRGNELIPQLDGIEQRNIRWTEIKYGVYLVAVGLIKKVLLADPLSGFVNPLFAKGEAITAVESWWAAYAFGFQIYFDFSAYSDMALGFGYMLGIKLILNFKSPYISSNPGEFWTRWHISLSRWIRDYVYIPLGGNRKGPVRVQINLFAAMVLSGLWHGAMWTFVWWGALHGLLLILHKWSLALNRWTWIANLRRHAVYRVTAVVIFFHVITWTWVFFRAEGFAQALDMSRKMFFVNWVELLTSAPMIWIGALYLLHLLEYALRAHEHKAAVWWHNIPFPVRSTVYAVLIMLLIYFQKGETYEFIYFQF